MTPSRIAFRSCSDKSSTLESANSTCRSTPDLLEGEARKRGISSIKLIELEITSKVVQPTEAEAQAFYDLNKSRIEGEFKDVKAEVIRYLLDQRRSELSSTLAKRLRAQSKIDILVPADSVNAPVTPADRTRRWRRSTATRITSGDVENSLLPAISSLQEQVYELTKAPA